MNGEFSVCQFFKDDTYEYVRRFVDGRTAMEIAAHYCHSVAAKIGITTRVIITDGGDQCVFEWKRGEGVTWPTPEQRAAYRDAICPGLRMFSRPLRL